MSREASLGTLRRLAPLLPVACALFAWAPLLDNYFKGDDFVHLYDMTSPTAFAGRGLVHGAIFGRDGTRLASVAQEGLIRVSPRRSTS